ncbi:MAG TPA: PDZ domain-containing protein [Gemmata sp.]
MFRSGKWAVAVALVGASVWAGVARTAQEPKPAAGAKAVDLTALREAVAAAARRGENVDAISQALGAFEKALPGIKPDTVPAELRALRDAVEAAAKKGESVDAIQKELAAVETAVAGRPLTPPKAIPQPEPPNRNDLMPLTGRIDPEAFQRATDLRRKALEQLAKNPGDREALKLLAEADQLMLKALLPGNGGGLVFPDMERVPARARLGIRFEPLAAVTADQLGLDPDVGVAVAAVVPGSAAERAGLKVHDIVVEFAGQPASSNADDFVRQVNAARAGERLDLVVLRKGKKVEIKGVVLADPGRPVVQPPLPVPGAPAPQRFPVPDVKPLLAPPLPRVAPIPEKADAVDIRADGPEAAKPDLGDLRDAVAAAEKRGDNVDSIRGALAALERVLAKGAAKRGDAPPELAALREAVESAAKKGENVAAISKELGAVEKALTGREYERPKIEEPKPDPLPEFPRRPGVIVRPPGGFNTTSVTISNGNFAIRARLNDVTYTITGTKDATVAPKIVIKSGDKTIETDDLKKVPDAYRPHVERLLKSVNR